MRVIGYHMGTSSIANSEGEVRTQAPWLDWLLSQSEQGTIQCLYNLDVDVARLLRLIDLSITEGRNLISKGRLYIAPYTLRYIPKKYFSIDKGFGKGHLFATFCDISQYRPAVMDIGDDSPVRLSGRANKAAQVGGNVFEILTSLGLKPNSLVSPIRAFQRGVLEKLDLPTVDHMPSKAGEFAYLCCKGSWLECFRRGHYDTWDYDLSSGYPYFASLLPDIRQGKWIHSKGKNRPIPVQGIGFWRGKVRIWSHFSPILYKPERDLSYTPTGTWDTYLTSGEWAFIIEHNLGDFDCEEGWRWEPDYITSSSPMRYPLQQTMRWLYSEKESSGNLRKEVIKRIMAGTYGKMLEVKQFENAEMGPLFNPVYAAEIETNTRLEVARLALENMITPLHIAVDGLLVGSPLQIPESNAMGSWQLVGNNFALIMGSGAVAIDGKKGAGDFSLDYETIMSYIRANPWASNYVMKKSSPLTLAKALNMNLWEGLGLHHDSERSVEFLHEDKRFYPVEPQDGGTLLARDYESVPWDMSILGRKGMV